MRAPRWDVVVVGAGPGGALAAREIARAGPSVLLVERSRWPRWKVCGSCLGPQAHSVLRDLGLGHLPREGGAVPLRHVVLHRGSRAIRLPLEGWTSWSRAALDGALVEAARGDGARFWPESHATLGELGAAGRTLAVRRGGGSPGNEERIVASVVVDATGLGGLPEGSPGPRDSVRPRARIGVGAIAPAEERVARDLPRGTLRMVVGDGGYVGLVRLEDDLVCVGAALNPDDLGEIDPGSRIGTILEEAGLPGVEAPIRGWRGTPRLTRRAERVSAPRFFRLGDAAGYVEPFTGEGIGWALADARAVAPLVLRAVGEGWSPELAAAWERHRKKVRVRERRLCRVLTSALRRPLLVNGGISLLSIAPWLARPVVRRIASPGPLPPRGSSISPDLIRVRR